MFVQNRECLRRQLKTKWNEQKLGSGTGLPFSLRLPNISKIDCCLSSSDSSTVCEVVLYISGNDLHVQCC